MQGLAASLPDVDSSMVEITGVRPANRSGSGCVSIHSERDKLGRHYGVTADFRLFFSDRLFGVLPSTCFYLPKRAWSYLFRQSVKIHYFCSGPIRADPICPQANPCLHDCERQCSANGVSHRAAPTRYPTRMFIRVCVYIYIYIYIYTQTYMYMYAYIYIHTYTHIHIIYIYI